MGRSLHRQRSGSAARTPRSCGATLPPPWGCSGALLLVLGAGGGGHTAAAGPGGGEPPFELFAGTARPRLELVLVLLVIEVVGHFGEVVAEGAGLLPRLVHHPLELVLGEVLQLLRLPGQGPPGVLAALRGEEEAEGRPEAEAEEEPGETGASVRIVVVPGHGHSPASGSSSARAPTA